MINFKIKSMLSITVAMLLLLSQFSIPGYASDWSDYFKHGLVIDAVGDYKKIFSNSSGDKIIFAEEDSEIELKATFEGMNITDECQWYMYDDDSDNTSEINNIIQIKNNDYVMAQYMNGLDLIVDSVRFMSDEKEDMVLKSVKGESIDIEIMLNGELVAQVIDSQIVFTKTFSREDVGSLVIHRTSNDWHNWLKPFSLEYGIVSDEIESDDMSDIETDSQQAAKEDESHEE